MHRDWKQRRASAEGRKIRNMIYEKHVDPKALERFRQKPYQQIYAEKVRQNKVAGGEEMVEVLECSVIRVSSVLNEWMDCVFVVRKDDEEKAIEVLKKAWDDFWKDNEGWCYGDYLEERLAEANIEFDSYYAKDAME